MAKLAPRMRESAEAFDEKHFYLEEFRAHTLCFAVSLSDGEQPGACDALGTVVRELVANQTRVVVLLGICESEESVASRLQRVRRRLQRLVLCEQTARWFPAQRGRRTLAPCFVDLTADSQRPDPEDLRLETVWKVLRSWPLLVATAPASRLVDFAQRLAVRLRVHKLVFVESAGGISTAHSGHLSFMDEAMLTAVLHDGEAEWTGVEGRRQTLTAVQAALRGGVHAVNVCTLPGLARELYTYEGSGTLFTLADYCRVERLGVDEFEQVERLLERGQREGFLKLRSPAETARILLNGYGATIGANHLAGVCALETAAYRQERAGEIVALYTITRFKGEGVGVRLIERVLADARDLGLRYVFACAVDSRAQVFFLRRGFREVSFGQVPATKWIGYDETRRQRVKIYRRDLTAAPGEAAGAG